MIRIQSTQIWHESILKNLTLSQRSVWGEEEKETEQALDLRLETKDWPQVKTKIRQERHYLQRYGSSGAQVGTTRSRTSEGQILTRRGTQTDTRSKRTTVQGRYDYIGYFLIAFPGYTVNDREICVYLKNYSEHEIINPKIILLQHVPSPHNCNCRRPTVNPDARLRSGFGLIWL